MLDYYFCEQCETYHQPNRIINGQILSACECQIQIQSASKQSRQTFQSQTMTTPIKNTRNFVIPSNNINKNVLFHYRDPIQIHNNNHNRNLAPVYNEKTNTFPFLAIAKQENKSPIKKFMMTSPSTQRIQSGQRVFASPRQVRVQQAVQKVRNQHSILPSYAFNSNISKFSANQGNSMKIINKTPIQTIDNLYQIVPVEPSPETMLSIQIPTSHKIQSQKQHSQYPKNDRKVVLDRLSGQDFSQYEQEKQLRHSMNQRITLDSVAIDSGAIPEQNTQCCHNYCYN